ncbi:hypothetical protein N9Y35_00770 [Flavobacteriales bacterium]|nr:hypothetical protein [Flavobacteriales bacterium]
MTQQKLTILDKFITEKPEFHSAKPNEIRSILNAVEQASKAIHETINRAGLVDILGAAGSENVQGEQVQKNGLICKRSIYRVVKKMWPYSSNCK